MLTNIGKKSFISFGGVYVLQAEVLTETLKFDKPPRIVPSHILIDPSELHRFLFETQAHLLLDKKQERQVFLIPRNINQTKQNSTINSFVEIDNRLNILPSLITKQTSLTTSGESLGKIFKSDKLWNQEDRWANKQKRSERLQNPKVLSKNEELLFSYVAQGDINEIKNLVNNENISLNIKKPGSGVSLLHVACQYEDIQLVKELVDMGADVNISSSNGSTPLHWASQQGALEIVEFLLSCGADVFATTNSWLTDSVYGKSSGQTPLHWAAEKGNIQVVLLLLKYGSMPHVTDETGKSAKDLSKEEELKKIFSEEENLEYTPILFTSSSGVATDASNLDKIFQNNNNNNT